MELNATPRTEVPPEQLVYARWIDAGTRAGLALLVLAFAGYLGGVTDPYVPLSQLPQLWSLPVDRYLEATGLRPGWGWIVHATRGDMLNVVAVAALSAVTLAAYVRLAIACLRREDRAYALLAAAEVAVLAAAVAGLAAGH